MSVIYKAIKRKSNPFVAASPEKFYPQIVTLGSKVNLKFIAERMHENSSLTTGDIKSVIQNFVEKLKEQLLEGKTVNIEGLGVFLLSAQSKGEETAEELTADSIDGVRICFRANKELKLQKNATRVSEKLQFVRLEDHLNEVLPLPDAGDGDSDSGNGDNTGGGDIDDDI